MIVESGESTKVDVDADTGEVHVTADKGTVDFETSMGNVMMGEGNVIGALLNAETGEVIMTAEVGMMEFETAMGKVMMDEGEAMGAHIDAESGQMFMSAERGDIMFETSAGTANLEHGEIVGTAFDQDTGQVTMMAMEGEVSFDTPMGMAVMQEGAVMEVTFDDNTGEMSMSSGGGSYTLETDNGIITMEDGGSMEFTVDHNTGEITVTGVTGEIVMTNKDGTTMTIETGTNLGIMHDGSMESDDGHDGYEGQEGEGPEDGTFEDNSTETYEGMVYEGTMTDAFGMWTGTYNEADNMFVGMLQLNDGSSFIFGADGSVMDQYGNQLTQQQIQQLMGQTGGDNNDNNNNATSPHPSPEEVTFDNVPQGLSDQPVNSGNTASSLGVNFGYKYGGSDDRFAVIHTGGPSVTMGKLGIEFNFAEAATRTLSFDYNFITTESGGSDTFTAILIMPDLSTETLVSLTSSVSGMTGVSGLTGLDNTTGDQTGWLTYEGTWNIPAGITQLVFEVNDVGGNDNDSAALIDNVLDPIVETSSTDYMLTFARMLRGLISMMLILRLML